jgi:hypothetical protein
VLHAQTIPIPRRSETPMDLPMILHHSRWTRHSSARVATVLIATPHRGG